MVGNCAFASLGWNLMRMLVNEGGGAGIVRSVGERGEFLEAPPQTRLKALFRKGPKNSQASLHGASAKTAYQIHSHVSRKPHAVKFWEFLEPSPKEGSKRGLGQSPKVSPLTF